VKGCNGVGREILTKLVVGCLGGRRWLRLVE